jgi:hypothetical protein
MRTQFAVGCNLRRKLKLSQFIVPTGKYFGCATKVLSQTEHHLPTLRAVLSHSQLIAMFIRAGTFTLGTKIGQGIWFCQLDTLCRSND